SVTSPAGGSPPPGLSHEGGGEVTPPARGGGEPAIVRPRSFQPMNINYGLLPDLAAAPTHDSDGKKLKGPERGRAKKQAQSRRALADLAEWLA
ncbi:MAG: FADH(2)-oxidizing methylenetetrahydrofolate--tRNA-(uracil(54)-C(5))-methyltransferase TrmFO, partial [Hyphomicrobium sp.]